VSYTVYERFIRVSQSFYTVFYTLSRASNTTYLWRMTTRINQLDTWYVPEDETHHIRLPSLRDGNDESQVLLADDRGDLLVPCYVDEADHDGLLLLQQYGAAPAFVETVRAAAEYGDIEPTDQVWSITRTVVGSYEIEPINRSADEMM